MTNDIWQSLGIDLNNINVYAKCHQNIPHDPRDRTCFTFSEFGPRQSLDQRQMVFGNPLGKSCHYQCVYKISSKYSTWFKRYDQFHLFRSFTSTEPRPMTNGCWQSLGLDLVNIKLYAKFNHQCVVYSRTFKTPYLDNSWFLLN